MTIGYTLLNPKLHLIYHHDFRMMSALLAELAGRGYRRIGLLELREHDARAEHTWLAAFLAAQHGDGATTKVPPLMLERPLHTPSRRSPEARVVSGLLERRCDRGADRVAD